jgi:threonine/homoserine/homoserine lactone efflux protein
VLYIVTQSVSRGRAAGVVSMLGIQTGGLVHVAAASLGLSSLLVSSATAFNAVKYAGAAYLVYLALRRLFGRDEAANALGAPRVRSRRSLYLQGVLVNVLNPKTALFFFAFLPQFVDVEAGSVGLQILILGCLFIVLATLSDGLYALAASGVAARVRSRGRLLQAERYVSACVFLGLGVATAVTGSRK